MRATNMAHRAPIQGTTEWRSPTFYKIVGELEYRQQFFTCPTANNYTLFDRTCQ